jgi:hypothetical protein
VKAVPKTHGITIHSKVASYAYAVMWEALIVLNVMLKQANAAVKSPLPEENAIFATLASLIFQTVSHVNAIWQEQIHHNAEMAPVCVQTKVNARVNETFKA